VRGIRSALAAGMKVIGIATTNSEEMLHEAHVVIKSFRELKPADVFKLFNLRDFTFHDSQVGK
jgi:beta-phosphoglucomutase-like phosphatase (HAD superfamily)